MTRRHINSITAITNMKILYQSFKTKQFYQLEKKISVNLRLAMLIDLIVVSRNLDKLIAAFHNFALTTLVYLCVMQYMYSIKKYIFVLNLEKFVE